MNIETENYQQSRKGLPESGQYIIAHQTAEELVVYQAYKPGIANVLQNQILAIWNLDDPELEQQIGIDHANNNII